MFNLGKNDTFKHFGQKLKIGYWSSVFGLVGIETWFFHWTDVGNFEFLWYCKVDQRKSEKFRKERSEEIDAFLEQALILAKD